MEMHVAHGSTEQDCKMGGNAEKEQLEFAVLKKQLKVVRRNIDKKITKITYLQYLLSKEECELTKYFDEEKELKVFLKGKKPP